MMRPILLLVVISALSQPAERLVAQGRVDLDYGPHGVGFRVMETLDSTRAFRPLRDFRGRLAAESARPVQISIWYPARPAAGARRMRAGEFRLLRELEVDFNVVLDEADTERLRSEFIERAVDFGQERSAATRLWDEATPAVRDAPPSPGPHPTVLYLTAAGVSNPLLPAYLASHGFVVASFPSNGRMTGASLEFAPNALTMDTDIDDAGFVHSILRRLPYADTERLAVVSFSGGSLAALLWIMRDMQGSAIVTIEGWERFRRGADIISGSVHYEPHRVRMPYLILERAADEASPRYAKVPDVVGELPYADMTRVAFRDAAHGDFLSHVAFGETREHTRIYLASARTIRWFLQTTLEGDGDAARTFASLAPPVDDPFFTMTRRPAVGPVPTEEELYRLAETDPPAAANAYRDATRIVPGAELFREHVLRRAAVFARTSVDSASIMGIVEDAYRDSSAQRSSPLTRAEPSFFGVSVADLEASTTWYHDILGLEAVRDVTSADGTLRARVLSSGPVVVELIHHHSARAPDDVLEAGAHRFQLQGIVKAGLFVGDIDALYDRLRRLGVEMDHRIGTDAEMGIRFFVFRDPDGNRLQVLQRR